MSVTAGGCHQLHSACVHVCCWLHEDVVSDCRDSLAGLTSWRLCNLLALSFAELLVRLTRWGMAALWFFVWHQWCSFTSWQQRMVKWCCKH